MEPALGRRLCRSTATLWVAPPALVLVWAWGELSWARPYSLFVAVTAAALVVALHMVRRVRV
jgi:hypothetical protein